MAKPPAGMPVSVSPGHQQATDTRAGADGRWSATLPAMPAGGPYVLTATAGGRTAASDVLIGDVFFCTGQSNMALAQRAPQGGGAGRGQCQPTDRSASSPFPIMRSTDTASSRPAHMVRWQVGSPQTVGGFSGACYYFVRELKRSINVPMGMIVAAWGGAACATG